MEAVVSATHAFDEKEFLKAASEESWDSPHDGKELDPLVERFLKQVHEDAIAEDLIGMSIEDVLHLAKDFWKLANIRKPGETLARIREGECASGEKLRRDILEIVSTDRPFLVDSVMADIASLGHDVLAMFHPIVVSPRNEKGERMEGGEAHAESMIQVHLEPVREEDREELIDSLHETLDDVRMAVEDWSDMLGRMDRAIEELESAETPAPEEELEECVAFLRWLRDDHFAFLGCRTVEYSRKSDGKLEKQEPQIVDGTGRGILRDPDRTVLRRGSEPAVLTPQIQQFLREPTPIIVAKANARSRVHRRVYMDYIGVKRYDQNGDVTGETRFVGLFTAEAYNRMARDVPLVRRKVRRVLERADKLPGSHNAKKLQNIVENYPRDELFQTEEDDLLQISLGILHLEDRPRPRLFMRHDRFDRFVSALVFIPRERYNTRLREQIGDLLKTAYDGRLSAFYPHFGDGALARCHFIIGLNPFNHPDPDPQALEKAIAELARTWEDDFEAHAREHASDELRAVLSRYSEAFTAGYRERFSPEEALDDVAKIEALGPPPDIEVRAYRREEDEPDVLRFKIYHADSPLALSKVMPIFEALGLHVIWEAGHRVEVGEGSGQRNIWVHDFEMRAPDGADPGDAQTRARFEEAFAAAWTGRTESDGFNALILQLGVDWRDAAFLRTCARFRRQAGGDASQTVQEETLIHNPQIARLLLQLRDVRFDPEFAGDMKARADKADDLDKEIEAALTHVTSLDHDRVARRLRDLLKATLRTNFYQRGETGDPLTHISLKIDSKAAGGLPDPKPYREIFVWAPHVEGVHLRFGPVARGGLRWSDRRDDFRTEVLGLVKAQQVKNAVIVPVGSKGGFYPKQLPRGDRDAWLEEGRRAYRTFIRGMLDITDNIVEDDVIHPGQTVIWDGEDPYLVVAADKGTATFSDMANAVAAEYDFWLGDAFASGGSAGYDHKAMGITARGGWEAVKRHFRELGKDIQSEPFTAIGIGDMSGDVFGNGMLLSEQTRLIAAFDHRDIFFDPDPDPAISFAERKRLFELPRSSWQDYDTSLISKGGGVFSRDSKSITLTEELKAFTGIRDDAVTPIELIHAILKAQAELLWFGGIGTYVKAEGEQDWQVGDKANDALRVNGAQLNVKVIGEGANLGVTQRGRIEFARNGGKINTDAVDNSAGVDTSDHEVNIKILLNGAVRAGKLDLDARNTLLESMTEDVGRHVLAHNYNQTLAISIAEVTAPQDLDAHERLMIRLEEEGRLDRHVENLPTAEQIAARREEGKGLTRPEIAVLLAYAKLTLFDDLVDSGVPDDPHFDLLLRGYFPKALHKFDDEMQAHRLKREIIATVLANHMCNLGGPTFVNRARETTGASVGDIARAFESARRIFRYSELTRNVNALDNKIPAVTQIELHRETMRLLRRQTYWLARRGRGFEQNEARPVSDTIAAYQPGVDALKAETNEMLSPFQRKRMSDWEDNWVKQGAPADVAHDVAQLLPLTSASDVIDLAQRCGWELMPTAWIYHKVGARYDIDRLRGAASKLTSPHHWDRLAGRRLTEEFYSAQMRIVESIMIFAGGEARDKPDADWAKHLVDRWITANRYEADRAENSLKELKKTGSWTLSKLSIAQTYLREFADLSKG